MLKSVEGVFRNGRVELLEPAPMDEARVVVTFLPLSGTIRLSDRGVDEQQAAELRAKLTAFAEDWDRPDMDVYEEV